MSFLTPPCMCNVQHLCIHPFSSEQPKADVMHYWLVDWAIARYYTLCTGIGNGARCSICDGTVWCVLWSLWPHEMTLPDLSPPRSISRLCEAMVTNSIQFLIVLCFCCTSKLVSSGSFGWLTFLAWRTSPGKGRGEKDVKWKKIPWVTHRKDLYHQTLEWLIGLIYVTYPMSHSWEWITSFFSDVNSPKVNVSSSLYMGMIYILFINESKTLSNWFLKRST